jgi:hypothetical protein
VGDRFRHDALSVAHGQSDVQQIVRVSLIKNLKGSLLFLWTTLYCWKRVQISCSHKRDGDSRNSENSKHTARERTCASFSSSKEIETRDAIASAQCREALVCDQEAVLSSMDAAHDAHHGALQG